MHRPGRNVSLRQRAARISRGDALQEQSYQVLIGSEKAQMVFNDSPYNVKIKGNVTKQKHHEEFAQGSGEMSKDEFTEFLKTAFSMQAKYSIDGSIHFQCMDFRHMLEILNASQNIYADLINLCVWDKGTGGMGSLYRSQHRNCSSREMRASTTD